MKLELAKQSIGRRVVYRPNTIEEEHGVITSCNNEYVFVNYRFMLNSPRPTSGGIATRPEDLEFDFER